MSASSASAGMKITSLAGLSGFSTSTSVIRMPKSTP